MQPLTPQMSALFFADGSCCQKVCGNKARFSSTPIPPTHLPRPPRVGPAPTLCDVQVEEVAVEDGLHHARHHGDLVEDALRVVAPHPVGDVECAVEAQEEEVVGGDGLGLARLGDHEQLWHDGHRLQEDGEGPQDLGKGNRPGGRSLDSAVGSHVYSDLG